MFKNLLLALLISTQAMAGLPPTTVKAAGDSAGQTAFSFQFPDFTPTRTGVTTSLAPAGNGEFTKNYISANSGAEVGTTGWAAYADAAGTSPVDATAGSPTTTWTRSTSSPLDGTGSFLLTKDAANRQGEGGSYAFTIQSTDQAKVMQISTEYIVGSGTFVAGTSTTDSDVTIWIYDVTNATVIQPSTHRLYSNSSTTSATYISNFQTASNSTSYRLIFHVGSTSASAYTLKFDRVKVSPTSYVYGTPITDWASCPITVSAGFGTVSAANMKAFCRRVGDSKEVQGTFLVGTAAASTASIILDTGTIDTAKIGTVASVNIVGHWWNIQTGASRIFYSQDKGGPLFYDGSDTNDLFIATASASNAITKVNGSSAVSSADYVGFSFTIPMSGWSSSVQMSDSADARVTAANVSGTVASTTAGNIIIFPTVLNDTHAAYNASTGQYKIPSAGWYNINATVITTNANITMTVYKNGSTISGYQIGYSTGNVGNASNAFYFASGDLVDIRPGGTTGSILTGTNFSIFKISGPSAIAATETISMMAYLAADQAVTANNPVKYDTVLFDTHGAYSTSTGKFTCPASGDYSVYTSNKTTSTACGYYLQKNSTSFGMLGVYVTAYPVSGSTTVRCLAGDTLNVNMDSTLTADGTSAPYYSHISIFRIR